MNASELKEAQLSEHIESLLKQIGLTLIQKEVAIGQLRLDAIAEDAEGALVVIELKTNRAIATLGQLLLYPHVLRKAIRSQGYPERRVKARLITTYLDSNVLELIDTFSLNGDIAVSVCIGSAPHSLKLVSPAEAPEQVKDQGAIKSSSKAQKIWTYLQPQRL